MYKLCAIFRGQLQCVFFEFGFGNVHVMTPEKIGVLMIRRGTCQ